MSRDTRVVESDERMFRSGPDEVVPTDGVAPTRADRFMRALLRVPEIRPSAETSAHRAFRTSLVVSGIRCIITYLAVPILVPAASVAGMLAAPIGILLSLFAVVCGIAGVRRFWISDHRFKWTYTWFMVIVFVVLGFGLVSDITRLVTQA